MIRIRFGAMPALLSEIVRSALKHERDFAVLHATAAPEPQDAVLAPATAQPLKAEDCDILVVCPEGGRDPGVALESLAGSGPSSIITLSPDGGRATVVSIGRRQHRIAATDDLCAVIRNAGTRTAD